MNTGFVLGKSWWCFWLSVKGLEPLDWYKTRKFRKINLLKFISGTHLLYHFVCAFALMLAALKQMLYKIILIFSPLVYMWKKLYILQTIILYFQSARRKTILAAYLNWSTVASTTMSAPRECHENIPLSIMQPPSPCTRPAIFFARCLLSDVLRQRPSVRWSKKCDSSESHMSPLCRHPQLIKISDLVAVSLPLA